MSLVVTGQNNSNFYLHKNGVTCMCPKASINERGVVNGVTYTKRTRDQITVNNASTTCTSGITDMSSLFSYEYLFNGNISSWDTSNVTNMSEMFSNCRTFNQPIGKWNTSKTTNMLGMFSFASAFNQPIGEWDTSNVISMRSMFNNSKTFNQPIGEWNTSKVINMIGMFYYALNFNASIENWDTRNLTHVDFMFNGALTFNKSIGDWDTSKITDMNYMFSGATNFNQPINAWCVENVTSEPVNFSTSSALSEVNKPIWGADCSTLSNNTFEWLNYNTNVYPNPFTSDVTVNLPENSTAQQIQIVNAVGQTVYTSVETKMNLEHLSIGIYFLKVNTTQGNFTKKIIKK